MSNVDITYKLLTLELLNNSSFSLSNSQISEFFVHYGYADYFRIQQILHELKEGDFLNDTKTHNTTLYDITPAGIDTLKSLRDRITPAMKEDIKEYFIENKIDMENDNNIKADYLPASAGGYFAHLGVARDGLQIIDLHIHVDSEEMARTLTTNWKRDYEKVYAALMEILI